MSHLYKKLYRLRQKRKRLDRRISILERMLRGKKARWTGCAQDENRK